MHESGAIYYLSKDNLKEETLHDSTLSICLRTANEITSKIIHQSFFKKLHPSYTYKECNSKINQLKINACITLNIKFNLKEIKI